LKATIRLKRMVAGLKPCVSLNSLACRPLLRRRNVNDPNNSAGDNSSVDAKKHLIAEAEAGHCKPHANVRIKTDYEKLVK
jgi:hypothetical protein